MKNGQNNSRGGPLQPPTLARPKGPKPAAAAAPLPPTSTSPSTSASISPTIPIPSVCYSTGELVPNPPLSPSSVAAPLSPSTSTSPSLPTPSNPTDSGAGATSRSTSPSPSPPQPPPDPMPQTPQRCAWMVDLAVTHRPRCLRPSGHRVHLGTLQSPQRRPRAQARGPHLAPRRPHWATPPTHPRRWGWPLPQ